MKIVFLLLSIYIIPQLISAQNADFLLVENPSELTIYNKYQQSISDQFRDQLVPFTPFQIIEEDELLSDQISHASRVIFNDNIYFILKDEENNYISDDKEYFRVFKNCELIGDTIKILRNDRVAIFSKPEYLNHKNQHTELIQNRYCSRIFKFKNLYFLKAAGDSIIYGWTQLPHDGWQVSHEIRASLNVIPEHLVSRLKIRIDSANQDYENFFNHFNKKYNRINQIPYWNLEISDHKIKGILNDPSLSGRLKNSNRYLMQDIDNIFLGSNFITTFSDSMFSIKPGSKHK